MSANVNDLWPRLFVEAEYDCATNPLTRLRPHLRQFAYFAVGDGALDVPRRLVGKPPYECCD